MLLRVDQNIIIHILKFTVTMGKKICISLELEVRFVQGEEIESVDHYVWGYLEEVISLVICCYAR